MYFPELSPYSYFQHETRENLVNVGWLDAEEPFALGDTSDLFKSNLWAVCKISVAQARGFHMCNICTEAQSPGPKMMTFNGEQLSLGFAEIRVIGLDKCIYAAPDLIFHYVVDHHYLPPEQFVVAVESLVFDQKNYMAQLEDKGFEYRLKT